MRIYRHIYICWKRCLFLALKEKHSRVGCGTTQSCTFKVKCTTYNCLWTIIKHVLITSMNSQPTWHHLLSQQTIVFKKKKKGKDQNTHPQSSIFYSFPCETLWVAFSSFHPSHLFNKPRPITPLAKSLLPIIKYMN